MKNPPSAYLEKLRSVLDHGGGRKVQYHINSVLIFTIFLLMRYERKCFQRMTKVFYTFGHEKYLSL